MIGGVEWARPWALWLLCSVPVWMLLRGLVERRRRVRFAPLELHSAPQVRRGFGRFVWPLEIAFVVAALVGLAGPHRVDTVELYEEEGIDISLVLDVSLSMLATDLVPTRLEATRRIAEDFIARRGGDRLGVVIFARDAFVQTPLTTDHAALRELLRGVDVYAIDQYRSGGTAVGDALLVAGEQLEAARVEDRDQALVLLTDGESNEGIDASVAARWLGGRDVHVYAIGVGADEPVSVVFEGEPVGDGLLSALDEGELRSIAAESGGHFYRALDTVELEGVFAELSRLESAPLETVTIERRRGVSHRVAAVVLALFLLWFALHAGWQRRPLP